ncbi:MAG TPA: carboxypeptidase-like regulatory domain-containing protein [Puia sp.]|nr:carboxypeptidase-like regulatory domain-containing protein [Puia sp.]
MDFQAFIIQGCLVSCLAFTILPPPPFQQQGIEGIARRTSGNRMPSPKHHPGPAPGTHATVCVFGLTNENQVTNSGTAGLYTAVHTKLIRQADTDDSGHFRILLPPGTYSVFTRKGHLFYATRRDEKNNIAPVEVLPGKITRVDCSVESDHAAVY